MAIFFSLLISYVMFDFYFVKFISLILFYTTPFVVRLICAFLIPSYSVFDHIFRVQIWCCVYVCVRACIVLFCFIKRQSGDLFQIHSFFWTKLVFFWVFIRTKYCDMNTDLCTTIYSIRLSTIRRLPFFSKTTLWLGSFYLTLFRLHNG